MFLIRLRKYINRGRNLLPALFKEVKFLKLDFFKQGPLNRF